MEPNAPQTDPAPRCIHICCKSMMVFGEDFANDPDYQGDLTDFWCNQTGQGQGPDNEGVNMTSCSNSERGCYRAY